MEKILNRGVWIKDFKYPHAIGLFVIMFFLPAYFPLIDATKFSILMDLEQSLFVVLSAILFVFHKSIISYANIAKLRNNIKKLSNKDVKRKVLAYIKIQDQEDNYDEFLKKLITQWFYLHLNLKNLNNALNHLYVLFSLIGLILMFLLTPSYTIKSINIAKYLVDFLVYSQLTLILCGLFQYSKLKIKRN
jgi:hypothetical protein